MVLTTASNSAIADMPPGACTNVFARGHHATLENNVFPTFDALGDGDLVIRFIFGTGKLEWLQCGEGCTMIDSVVRAQHINVTDIQPCHHGNSHPNTVCVVTK